MIAGAVIVGLGVLLVAYGLGRGSIALYAERRPFLAKVRPGVAGAFPLGMAFAAGWTPCIGPVLGAILGIAATQSAVGGALLLLCYSVGLGVPFLLLGLGVQRLMGALGWLQRRYEAIAVVSGLDPRGGRGHGRYGRVDAAARAAGEPVDGPVGPVRRVAAPRSGSAPQPPARLDLRRSTALAWRTLRSMRTALVLLLLLALASVGGSLVPQVPNTPERVARYLLDHPFWGEVWGAPGCSTSSARGGSG